MFPKSIFSQLRSQVLLNSVGKSRTCDHSWLWETHPWTAIWTVSCFPLLVCGVKSFLLTHLYPNSTGWSVSMSESNTVKMKNPFSVCSERNIKGLQKSSTADLRFLGILNIFCLLKAKLQITLISKSHLPITQMKCYDTRYDSSILQFPFFFSQ